MNYKKYHFVAGTLSLVMNIVLPTLIFNCYQHLTTLSEKTTMYIILAILFLLWITTLAIALRELGGLILRQINHV